MGALVSARIARYFAEAEQAGCLVWPQSNADARALRRRVKAGELTEPFPRLFARTEYWERVEGWARPLQILHSLALEDENRIFCSFSAACVYGLPVSLELLDNVYVAVSQGAHTGKKGRFVRCAVRPSPGIPTFNRGHVGDIRVTSPKQTVVDCLCAASFPQALAIADASLRFLGIDSGQLEDLVKRYGGQKRGINTARRAARYADARSESGGESIARAIMIEEGFAVPELQVEFPNILDPYHPFRVDGAWRLDDGSVIVFEFDGKDKYTRFTGRSGDVVGRMMRERQRESRLTAVCDAVVRFDYKTVVTPGALARVLDAYNVPRVIGARHGRSC